MTQYASVGTRIHFVEPAVRIVPEGHPEVALCGTIFRRGFVDQNAEWPVCRECHETEIARLYEEADQALNQARILEEAPSDG